MLKKLAHRLAQFEDMLLVTILASILFLAVGQILLRNFFDTGIVWFDSLSRILVLWLALIAAGIASREKQHLAIDLLALFPKLKPIAGKIVGVFSATVCLAIAFYSVELIQFEFEDGYIAFANVPTWVTQLIIPASFSLMGIRYLLQLFISEEELEL